MLCINVNVFMTVRGVSTTSKIQMDPTRDSAIPYVGLAFKLEVTFFFFIIISAIAQEDDINISYRVVSCCVLYIYINRQGGSAS